MAAIISTAGGANRLLTLQSGIPKPLVTGDTIDFSDVALTTSGLVTASGGLTVSSGNITLGGGAAITTVLDEDNMASDSATALATQQSIKAYVDSQVGGIDTLSELNDTTIAGLASADILVYDGTDSWDNVAMSGDATIANTGALTLASSTANLTALTGGLQVSGGTLNVDDELDLDAAGGTLSANASYAAATFDATVTEAGSGTHARISTVEVGAPDITAGAAALTAAASLYIAAAPTEATNNYALWVDAGAVQIDGAATVGSLDASSGGISNAGAISGATTIDASGDLTVDTITMTGFSVSNTGVVSGLSGSSFGNLTFSDGSITDSGGTIDFGTDNLTTGGILKVDVDGSALNAAGSITMGAGNDAGAYFDGTNLVIMTDGAGASGIILDSEDDTVEIKGSGTLQATFDAGGLDLVTGDEYSINGASVLNATTLGSAVVTSSLTTVGALNSGSIATGFGNIDNGTSNITSGGVWTIDVDGTAIGAAGSLNFGAAGNDAAAYWDGTNFIIDTTAGVAFEVSGTQIALLDNTGMDLATGDAYQINNTSVLDATTLGSGVVTSSLTTVGALNSGSITSGFGSIDNGSSAITTTGTITGGTVTDGTFSVTAGAITGVTTIDTSGNVTVGGDLTVSGTTTTVDTETLVVDDNIVIFNSSPIATSDGGWLTQRHPTLWGTATLEGTAQAGSGTGTGATITLAAGASGSDDTYNNWSIYLDGGTGNGQWATITDYVGATKVATLNADAGSWGTAADNTSTYDLHQNPDRFMGVLWDESVDTFIFANVDYDPGTIAVTAEDHVAVRMGALTVDDAAAFGADGVSGQDVTFYSAGAGKTMTWSNDAFGGVTGALTLADSVPLYLGGMGDFTFMHDGTDNLFTSSNGDVYIEIGDSQTKDLIMKLGNQANTSSFRVTDSTGASGTTGDLLAINADGSVKWDTAALDINHTGAFTVDGTGGGISLDSDTASNFTVASGNLTLSTTTSGTLAVTSAGTLDLDGVAVNIDSSGAMNITAADGQMLNLVGGDGTAGVSINGTGAVTVAAEASQALTLTGNAASTWHTSAGDLTVGGASQAGSLILQSAEATADAVKINASNAAGGIDIDAGSGGVDIDIASGSFDVLAGSTFSIDGTGASNVTATSGDLTVSTATSGDLNLTAADNININSHVELAADKNFGPSLTANETLAAGDIVAVDSSGQWSKADADASLAAATGYHPAGVAQAAITDAAAGAVASMPGASIQVAFVGEDKTAARGKVCYLSVTAGKASLTAPAAAGSHIYRLGIVLENGHISNAESLSVLWQPQFIATNT